MDKCIARIMHEKFLNIIFRSALGNCCRKEIERDRNREREREKDFCVSSITMKNNIYNDFNAKVFNENSSWYDLFTIACYLALGWMVFMETGRAAIYRLVGDKLWLKKAMQRDYEREGKKILETIGLEMTEEEYIKGRTKDWGWLQCVLFQHLIGGLLCIPSVFNLSSFTVADASSLACLSILSEMGWEIQDLIVMLYRRFCLEGGDKLVPVISLIIMPIHHSLTCGLGIPTILAYRNLKTLHWMCFDLQTATAISLFIAEYTKLLDVSQPDQLRQFTILTLLGFLVCVWARAIHWFYLLWQFVQVWIEDQAYTFLVVGCLVCFIFTLFSYFLCIEPFYKRLVKFMKLSSEYNRLPSDASPSQRRSSVINLQNAATELVATNEPLLAVEVAAFFEHLSATRKPSGRRESMPTSVLQRQRRLSGYSRGPVRALSSPMIWMNASFRTKIDTEQIESTPEQVAKEESKIREKED